MSQTYRTRVLTAADHRLVDALERDPRFRLIAERLRPGSAKPAGREPDASVAKPTPKPSAR